MKTKISKIYKEVYKSVYFGDNLNKFKSRVSVKINELYPSATKREKYEMYKACLQLRNSGDTRRNLEQIIKSENVIRRNEGTRARVSSLKLQMEDSRSLEEPIIFYLASHHANPAQDHEFWEGKLYVDRFWRNTVHATYPGELIKKIERFIKSNDIKTVQWVTGFPVYFITRPYCKHFFIPVPTQEVLSEEIKQIKKNHPESTMWYRLLKEEERGKRFQEKRELVGRALTSLPKNELTQNWIGYTMKRVN